MVDPEMLPRSSCYIAGVVREAQTHFQRSTTKDGVWRMAYGIWRMGYGVWDMAYGIWRLASGVWRLASGVWRLASGV
ncbi:hypothetical protein AC579_10100 [Pseudocercospora musae]|uniref:Uncharacterized protein n=1 Tax=Pseudocercospora musae TaxID=113226 RepID=A0A139I292_9PEZI|nr:hypothetical protein AC579_10100 [Pseudocercospora musae]